MEGLFFGGLSFFLGGVFFLSIFLVFPKKTTIPSLYIV